MGAGTYSTPPQYHLELKLIFSFVNCLSLNKIKAKQTSYAHKLIIEIFLSKCIYICTHLPKAMH